MQMRAQFQKITRIQRDFLLLQYFTGRAQREIGMGGEESLHDVLVFFRQEAASCVHQAPAFFSRRLAEARMAACWCVELFNTAGRLAEFKIRAAAQRAQPAARRIHQHAVDLAGQAFYLEIVLVRDQHRL